MVDFGKVRALRLKLALTQEQAARRAGMRTRQQWNDIESGRKANVSVETLAKIAKALNVKAKDLLK